MVDIRTERTRHETEEDWAVTEIDDDILEQIEEGQRDDVKIRDFEDIADDLGI